MAAVPLTTLAGPGGGGGGGPSGASILVRTKPSPAENANPDANATAVPAPLITVIKVLPMSPRTMRLAMNGINAMTTESRTLATLMTIIWLEPTNA